MTLDPRKRQKKLERRKAKEKKQALVERSSTSVVERLARAGSAPILDCCVNADIWDQGIGNVLVSRTLPKVGVAYVAFLVDMYCLGVKNVAIGIVSQAEYDWRIRGKICSADGDVLNLSPSAARKLVESAVEYAKGLGLAPHRDYRTGKA